ncbi:hypothetical protein N4G70_30030 [Streptomyces sp. ASQP_92]|uniref:hypothetical protein n=1 Tax=Streptomyces sp. ASQP_92 TaxID=2979116 RepID=UPI0021C01AB0|nr:hypothetical protein [Streptomyces sp. ASQP_92]MCT9093075.1 hypothetical protein [Streptomyces sp. ASQP_92]
MNTQRRLRAATAAASLLLLAAPGVAAADTGSGQGSVTEYGQPKVLGGQGEIAETLTAGVAMFGGALQPGGASGAH